MLVRMITVLVTTVLLASACGTGGGSVDRGWFDNALSQSLQQMRLLDADVSADGSIPRSEWTGVDSSFIAWQLSVPVRELKGRLNRAPADSLLGSRRDCPSVFDWTSGFYAGSLWQSYVLSGDECFRMSAERYTSMMYPVRELDSTHDLGFMMDTSYGNEYGICPEDSIRMVLLQTADNLCSRFNPTIGCIRSWDFGDWHYPVIIDNMVNLGLLFHAWRLSGEERYFDIAVRHADTTLGNHFRKDNSSWHVVSYNDDGSIESKGTYQGMADGSSWARGQAWGLYGYTVCYRETGYERYRSKAHDIFILIRRRVTTGDLIPRWDYDAPDDDLTPRDASAAAVTASALLELSTLDRKHGRQYFRYAERILQSLAGPDYLAEPGTNHGFILKHSTGALPKGSEIDTPINYADYYFLEAMRRYKEIKGY